MKCAIVAVGYNRPDSMSTLLNSVKLVENIDNNVDLIISIDKGKRQSEIVEIAKAFDWKYGEKIIRVFSERQGLKKHIIQCGDLTEKYDLVIVLEDDLIVSPQFYSYAKQAVEFYKYEDAIAGISLYKHQFHPGVCRPFEAEHNGYDAYMMQFAQSWGQCWTKKMWSEFKSWYLKNEKKDLSEGGILPVYISNWNKHSWLKYYMRYIVETDKFFIYPMISLSSNKSEAGQHCRIPNNDYQVPLLQGHMDFRFPMIEDAIKYDVFFERIGISDVIFPELDGCKILDLYGNRTSYSGAKYIISTKELPFKKIKSISLSYRPIEQNCIFPTSGNGIYLYDADCKDRIKKSDMNLITRYDIKGVHWKRLLHLGINNFVESVKLRFERK